MYDLTLKESLAVLAYKQSILENKYRVLAEWLDCYDYILPADRTLNHSALSIQPSSESTSKVYTLYMFTVLLESHYTSQEQSNIIRYLLCSTIPSPRLSLNSMTSNQLRLIPESSTYLTPLS